MHAAYSYIANTEVYLKLVYVAVYPKLVQYMQAAMAIIQDLIFKNPCSYASGKVAIFSQTHQSLYHIYSCYQYPK